MLSTPRQLRVSVNRKVLNPQTPGEPNNSDFGILYARLVNTKATFTGKSGPYSGNVAAHRHCHIAGAGRVLLPSIKLDVSQTLIEAEYGWLTANKPSLGVIRYGTSLRRLPATCWRESVGRCGKR
jgi:hypothetical protein